MRNAKQITTDREILGLRPQGKPYEVSVSGARGLLIRVFPDGTRVFETRYAALDGKRRRLQLGLYPTMSLAKARDAAGKLRNQVVDGGDPAAERAAAKAAARTGETVSDLAEAYFRAAAAGLHGGRKKPKKAATIAAEKTQFEKHLKPRLGDLRFESVRRTDIKQTMNGLASSGDLAPASVARIGETLSAIFAFAVHEDRLEHNPVRGLAHPLALTSRERRFDDDALKAIWRILVLHSEQRAPGKDRDDELSRLAPQTCLATRFLILTLSRRGEACGARWSEIDSAARAWTIPRERSKSGRAEVKPLSDATLEILDSAAALPDASEIFVFPAPGDATRALDDARPTRALARLCDRLELPHGSPHDFRRSGATTLTGRYGFSGYVAGLVLGHRIVQGARVTAVYDRYDRLPEKRKALDTWANHVLGLSTAQNIIPFAAAAS